MLGACLLLIQVSLRADVVGDAPRHPPIAADEHRRHPHVRAASHIERTAGQMHLVPTRDGLHRDVRIAGHHRPAARAAFAVDHPVVAADRRVRIADRLPNARIFLSIAGRPRRGAPSRIRLQDALVVRLGREKRAIERIVAQAPPGQLGHGDHRESAGQVPAKFSLDDQAIDGPPRLGTIVEEVELDRQRVDCVVDRRIDAPAEPFEHLLRFSRQFSPFRLGNSRQPDRPRQPILRQPLRSQNLTQSPGPFATQPIELKQPILRDGVAEAEKHVGIRLRKNVRHALAIATNLDGPLDGRPPHSIHPRHPRGGRPLPAPPRTRPAQSPPPDKPPQSTARPPTRPAGARSKRGCPKRPDP